MASKGGGKRWGHSAGGGGGKGTLGGQRDAVGGQMGGRWGRTLGQEEVELPRGRSWGRVTSAGSSSSWGRDHAVRTRPLPSKPNPHGAPPFNPTNQPPGCTQKPRPAYTDHAHRHLAPLRPPRSPITAVRSSTQSLHAPPTNHSPCDTGPAPQPHPPVLSSGRGRGLPSGGGVQAVVGGAHPGHAPSFAPPELAGPGGGGCGARGWGLSLPRPLPP